MLAALAWALVAAVVLGVVSLIFEKPRAIVTTWAARLVRRVQLRLYLQRSENTQRAIERIAEGPTPAHPSSNRALVGFRIGFERFEAASRSFGHQWENTTVTCHDG